jgi:hypothetical protein
VEPSSEFDFTKKFFVSVGKFHPGHTGHVPEYCSIFTNVYKLKRSADEIACMEIITKCKCGVRRGELLVKMVMLKKMDAVSNYYPVRSEYYTMRLLVIW